MRLGIVLVNRLVTFQITIYIFKTLFLQSVIKMPHFLVEFYMRYYFDKSKMYSYIYCDITMAKILNK